MMYQQIAGGANGLIFYSFFDVLLCTRKEEREKENLVLGLEGRCQ